MGNKVKVIDAPMGSGKSSWAIQEINKHPNQSYIYVTPFLEEIVRINKSIPEGGCGHRFKEPLHIDGGQKIEHFNSLIADGKDVAVTHSTFLNATAETIELLEQGEYICIIDEALDVIQNFNDVPDTSENKRQQVYGTDIVDTLKTYGMIEIDADMKVNWIGDSVITNTDNKYYAVCKYAKLGRLFCVDNKFLLIAFPPEMFACFKEIHVMTYLIRSSLIYYYFQKYGIEYEMKSIVKRENEYELIDYYPGIDIAFREKARGLINLNRDPSLNKYRQTALSKAWHKNKSYNNEDIKDLRNHLQNYLKRKIQCKAADVMWTTYKNVKKLIEVKGYKVVTKITNSQKKKMSKDEIERAEKRNSCFVPCNAKATNDFKDRWVLAYLINLNMNPEIAKFFSPIKVDKNQFSLGMLLQWIWRSRIRDDKPIELYLPSPRMRQLLEDWFDGKDLEMESTAE